MKPRNARIALATPDSVAEAAKLLQDGKLVAMPTETVYGLAANAFDEAAIASVFSTKERPTFDPLIVHIAPDTSPGRHPRIEEILDGELELRRLADAEIVDLAPLAANPKLFHSVRVIIETFWPGPLTIVFPKGRRIPDLVTSGLSTVAVRMPAHSVAQALIREAGLPLAAPSANRFGRISPTQASHVQAELGDRIELILDGGPCEIGLESTVIAIDQAHERLILLRPGKVSAAELEDASGLAVVRAAAENTTIDSGNKPARAANGSAQASPGMLASHYAPAKELRLLPCALRSLKASDFADLIHKAAPSARAVGLLAYQGIPSDIEAKLRLALPGSAPDIIISVLSAHGDLSEAARSLFAKLRALDSSDADVIFAELPPPPCEEGLAFAISDRLRRAAIRQQSPSAV